MPDQQIFFAMGTPKSGTTWLQFLLDAHPEIVCRGEGHFHDFAKAAVQAVKGYNASLADKNQRIFGQEQFPPMEKDEIDALLRAFMRNRLVRGAAHKPAARLIGEKNPDNANYIAMLAQLFPQALYVHIIRDGRDVAVSGWYHNQRYDADKHTRNNPDFAQHVVNNVRVWAEIIARVRSVAASARLRYHEVRYEDLAADPAKALAGVFGFMGADASDAVVRRCIDAAAFEKLSGGRQRGETDQGSFYRKGIAGDWRNHFDDQLLGQARQAGRGLLESLGYA